MDGGYNDGTIAWLFIGTNNATYIDYSGQSWVSPWLVEFSTLETIPAQNTTYNRTGFSDLWPWGTPNVTVIGTPYTPPVEAVNASYSNPASILQCNLNSRNETRLIMMVNQAVTIHEVPSLNVFEESGDSEYDWGYQGTGPVLAGFLNPLLGGASPKFSAMESSATPLSPVNWAAGELTLRAFGNASQSTVNGVAYYDAPPAPEAIASQIGKYVQSASKPYLIQGLLPRSIGVPARDAQILLPVTAFQTSLEQMFATICFVVLILILVITLLIIGIGSLPLTVSTVETFLQRKEGSYG